MIKSCISHLLYYFVSYKKLSPKFKAFVANLGNTFALKAIQEAVSILDWNIAIEEEMS